MENLNLEKTAKTPLVCFDYDSGTLKLSGRSIPEDSFAFFSKLLQWIDEYISQPQQSTKFIVDLEYFNTSSSKFLLEMLKKFKAIAQSQNSFLVEWCYEEGDDDMLDTGKEYMDLLNLEFVFNEVQ